MAWNSDPPVVQASSTMATVDLLGQRAFDHLSHAVALGLLAHDEGRQRRPLLPRCHGRGGHYGIRAQGWPADGIHAGVSQQGQERVADEMSALRVQAEPAAVEVVRALLTRRQGEVAVLESRPVPRPVLTAFPRCSRKKWSCLLHRPFPLPENVRSRICRILMITRIGTVPRQAEPNPINPPIQKILLLTIPDTARAQLCIRATPHPGSGSG